MSKLTKREEIFLSVTTALIGCSEHPDTMRSKIIIDAKEYTDYMIMTLKIKDPDK